jgi:cyclophilin family peptidyl-prolyl cis-trans isomerase
LKFAAALAVSFSILAAPVAAQTAPEWRTVEPQNLLVIDTVHGRILVELDPRVAPLSVERIRTLADRGFYDGLKFHRVIGDFMAQTGDPQGTGQGGSELPDVNAEFQFRRGRDMGFSMVQQTPQGQAGVMGSMAVVTQPDAQMMVTADFRAGAQALFCKGVAGMARNGADVNSANSQFFLMRADREDLNGQYSPFGRVVAGMDVVQAIKVGQGPNGQVTDPDIMSRVRTAAAMPEGQRPSVRVMNTASPAFAAFVEQTKAARGASFNICDAQPPAELVGG